MTREPHIPLFLWVTAAIVVHALGGGSATEVAKVVEEQLDIKSFAGLVQRQARLAAQPVEVSLVEEPERADDLPELAPEDAPLDDADQEVQSPPDEPEPPEPEKKKKEEKKEEKAPKQQEKKKTPAEPKKKEDEQRQVPPSDPRRIAVVQHVDDEDQKDNPNASFAGEHANHVEEETQAQITSTDQNARKPSPGERHAGSEPEPGNSEEHRIAQSEETAGDPDVGPGQAGQDEKTASRPTPTPPASGGAQRNPRERASVEKPPQEASKAREAVPDTHSHPGGAYAVDRSQEGRRAQPGQRQVPRKAPQKYNDLLGYGSTGTTKNGVNLNLNHRMAQAVVGADEMDQMKRRAGQRRLSQHRGSWQNVGLERWRPALENYVAAVKPGNQTALNTARVPFAQYLNKIHQRLHQIFADGFLESLAGLPGDHPLSNQEMSTHLEIALSQEDGRIVKMGVTKSSGVTMFDVGALESVRKAAPFGVPPGSIVSGDGNVYLHWEFHRKRIYACSTYFARPFILDVDQKQAPPRVEPPPRPKYDDDEEDERSGSIKAPPVRAIPPERRPG